MPYTEMNHYPTMLGFIARVHRTLGVTPAMTAGVADHVWTIEELVSLADSNV